MLIYQTHLLCASYSRGSSSRLQEGELYLQNESCDYFTISLGRDASHSVKVTTLYVCKDVMNESCDDIL